LLEKTFQKLLKNETGETQREETLRDSGGSYTCYGKFEKLVK